LAACRDIENGVSDEPHQLTESEVALIAALKTVIEIMLNAGIAPVAVFDEMFAGQRDSYIAKGLPTAAGVIELLRLFATDPAREALRQQRRRTVSEQPKDSA